MQPEVANYLPAPSCSYLDFDLFHLEQAIILPLNSLLFYILLGENNSSEFISSPVPPKKCICLDTIALYTAPMGLESLQLYITYSP